MYPEDPADHLARRSQHSAIRWTNAPQPPMPPGPGQSHSRGDGIDLTQLWWMLRDNAGLVFAIAGIVFTLAMYKCLTSPMTFLSTGRLYMGESGAGIGVGAELDIGSGVNADAAAEIEVLRSRSMVSAAALAAGVNVSITPPEWQPPVMWRWLLSERDPALLDPASEIVGVTDTQLRDGIIGSRAYAVKFTSTTDYVLSGGEFGSASGTLGNALSTPEVNVTLLPGSVGPSAGTELVLRVDPLDTTVERTQAQLGVTVPKTGSTQARVLVLTFASNNRRLAESFLTQLMRTYLEVRHAWKTEEATAAEDFVTDQLKSLRSSLDQTQEKLADYRTENKVVVMADEAQSIMQQVNRYEEQRVHAQLELTSLRDIREALKSSTLPIEAYMVGEARDEVLQRQAAALEEARARMTTLSSEYNTASPEIKRSEAQVKAQLGAIRSYVNAKIARAEKQVGALNKVISEHESKLATIPGAELAVSQLGRESEVYSKMYSYLLERRQQAAITKASTVSKNRILDTAYVPLQEDSPKLFLHLASSILGLLLGAAVVILRGLFSAVFRVENDVRGMLGPLQVFARIPARPRARFDGQAMPAFDLMGGQLSASYVEAFRSLRTNLYRALPGEHGKVVLVTSPELRDGKTSCALALAAMLAADNRRVLVVDADVRRPSHHSLLGVPQEPGLTDVVQRSGQAWRDAIRTMCLTSGSFDSVCAGPETNAELLSDERFNRFLVHARSQYDFVILDGPSYPAVSDPLVLAPLSDFVLSVVRLGHTSRRVAEEHLTAMFSESRGLAVALNEVQATMPSLLHSQAAPRQQSAFRRLR